MLETKLYAFRISKNVLIIDFLKPDAEVLDCIVGSVKKLGQSSLVNGNELSDVILHLHEKSWASMPLLYDLAYQIKKHSLKNEINWIETFMHIEIINLGKQHARENYKPTNDDKGFVVPGYTHISEIVDKTRLLIDFVQNVNQKIVDKTRLKVIKELEDRGII